MSAEEDEDDAYARFMSLSSSSEDLTEAIEEEGSGGGGAPGFRDEPEVSPRIRELRSSEEGMFDMLGDDDDDLFDAEEDDSDEFDPPKEWTYDDFTRAHWQINEVMSRAADWLHNSITGLRDASQEGREYFVPSHRLKRLQDKWQDFLMAHETMAEDVMALPTHEDRVVHVAVGPHAFANMMQMLYLRMMPRMMECGNEIRQRFNQTQDPHLLDADSDDDEDDQEGGGGGWGDPRNANTQYKRERELLGERTSMRIFRFRVVHLGKHYAPWITRLTKSEYKKDQQLRAMSYERWLQWARANNPATRDKKDEEIGRYQAKERIRLPYWKRVVSYTQEEVMRGIKLIARDINRLVPTQELRDFFDALMLRNSMLYAETCPSSVLDCQDHRDTQELEDGSMTYSLNRRHIYFSYYYFYPVLCRFMYHELYEDEGNQFTPHFGHNKTTDAAHIKYTLKNGITRLDERFKSRFHSYDDEIGATPDDVAKIRRWVEVVVFESLGEEGLNKLYCEVAEDMYSFPGDRNFFRYLHPKNPSNTAAVLQSVRPEDKEVGNELQEEFKVSLENIKAGIGYHPMSDVAMLRAIGTYFVSEIHGDLDWYHTCVIDAADVNHGSWTIMYSDRPLLVQVFSDYMVVYKGHAYRTRDTLESVALWFKMLDRWFDGCFSWEVKSGGRYKPKVSIRHVLNDIFRPKQRYADKGSKLHERPLK